MHNLAWLIPVLPLLGAAFIGLIGPRIRRSLVVLVALCACGASLLLSLVAFVAMVKAPGQRLEFTYGTWMATGGLNVPFGLLIDALSGTMMLIVTGIGFIIHVYSVGYMCADLAHHPSPTDPDEEYCRLPDAPHVKRGGGCPRYFAYLNLFVFFMLVLVLGSSLPVVFIGWEGVGLCSYLLIGYYIATNFSPDAGLKAFLFNRAGDLGMLVGMMVLFAAFGTLSFDGILTQAGRLQAEMGFGVLSFATLMIFFGATGKSAQIPLYLWLPDAMAGPTPVSALIHAATMVTAGVFLLCRLAPIFALAPVTMNVIAWVGAATALLAATMGLLQRDIKKVLAYSTISQLGYMFMGLGAAGFAAGFFHVFTHAWFKALLFLGAGCVIMALHHEQDIFNMGGLRRKLPITTATMCIGTLAIIGFPGFSGFFSKDEILYLAYLKHPALWGLGLLAACCTAFYMVRLVTLVFWGEPRDYFAYDYAHEPGRTMKIPLIVLAAGSVLAGYWGIPEGLGGHFAIGRFLEAPLTYGAARASGVHRGGMGLAYALASLSTAAVLGSAWFSFATYRNGTAVAEARAARFPRLHGLVLHGYYADEFVEAVVLRPVRWFGNLMWKLVDVIIIDALGVNLPGALTRVAGDFTTLSQTGRVRDYALVMAMGAAALLWIFLRRS